MKRLSVVVACAGQIRVGPRLFSQQWHSDILSMPKTRPDTKPDTTADLTRPIRRCRISMRCARSLFCSDRRPVRRPQVEPRFAQEHRSPEESEVRDVTRFCITRGRGFLVALLFCYAGILGLGLAIFWRDLVHFITQLLK